MKQVIFAISLLAMASLTGCLTDDDSPVDDNTDTTDDSLSDTTEDNTDTTQDNTDTTDDNKDEELVSPVVNSNITSPDLSEIEATLNSINNKLVAPYDSPDTATIIVDSNTGDWVAKGGNTSLGFKIMTSCFDLSTNYGINFEIYDSDDRIIYLANSKYDYGATSCSEGGISIDVNLGPEPVKVALTMGILFPAVGADPAPTTGHYSWIVTF